MCCCRAFISGKPLPSASTSAIQQSSNPAIQQSSNPASQGPRVTRKKRCPPPPHEKEPPRASEKEKKQSKKKRRNINLGEKASLSEESTDAFRVGAQAVGRTMMRARQAIPMLKPSALSLNSKEKREGTKEGIRYSSGRKQRGPHSTLRTSPSLFSEILSVLYLLFFENVGSAHVGTLWLDGKKPQETSRKSVAVCGSRCRAGRPGSARSAAAPRRR